MIFTNSGIHHVEFITWDPVGQNVEIVYFTCNDSREHPADILQNYVHLYRTTRNNVNSSRSHKYITYTLLL